MLHRLKAGYALAIIGLLFFCHKNGSWAADVLVSPGQLSAALQNAIPGDNLLLQPGTYNGGLYRLGLSDVTIRSADPTDLAIIQGGTNGLQLSAAQRVTLEDLVFEQQVINGINIDDAGDLSTPSTEITLRRVTFRDVGTTGNHDGIKLSGVNDFLLDQVQVLNWGNGGSAVDMVGSHRGLIQNSLFRDDNLGLGGSGLRPKGGSKQITFRANRIEMPIGAGRAITAGGSTDSQFFRFVDGDSNYEADEIVAEGNVILGGRAAMSYVNIDGGLFHHNYVERPGNWTLRILNENQGSSIVDTQNGVFRDNVVNFNDTATEYSQAVNIGSETAASSFVFSGNSWLNLADPTPAGSTPTLPSPEENGTYGLDSNIDPNSVIAWEFDWGIWLVNASDSVSEYTVTNPEQQFELASAGTTAEFVPSQSEPFVGEWEFAALTNGDLQLAPFSQLILANASNAPLPDTDADGDVDGADFLAWQRGFGGAAAQLADGNFDGDGDVDVADLQLWLSSYGASASPLTAAVANRVIPEPCAISLMLIALTAGGSFRSLSK